MKLNIGAGRTCHEGWFNIDAVVSPLAKRPLDLICDIRQIPLPDGCADEVMAIHVFEHFYRYECDAVIDEWRRLLKRGGLLALEMPDLYKCCRNVLEGRKGKNEDKPDQMGLWGLYGEVTDAATVLMGHHWAWTFATIEPFLAAHGFVAIEEAETVYHYSGRGVRDFRVTARKSA